MIPFQETIKEGSGGDGLLDLLLVRNDLSRRRLFLDVADDIWAKFKTLDRTAGMPVNLFPVPGNDAAFVHWSRAANTRKTLLDGLDGKRSNQGRIQGGGSWGSGPPPPFWGTPKLHKEGKNGARVRANGPHFST